VNCAFKHSNIVKLLWTPNGRSETLRRIDCFKAEISDQNQMKINLTFTTALMSLILVSLVVMEEATAQRPQLFGGRGIATDEPDDDDDEKGLQWPRLSDFTMGNRDADSRSSLFQYGKTGERSGSWFKRDETKEDRPAGGFMNFLPQRDPSAPNLFHELGDRSRNWMERTSNWAHERNQTIRTKTFDNWDAMTKNLKPSWLRDDDADELPYEQGAQPPLRNAEQFNVTPSDRF